MKKKTYFQRYIGKRIFDKTLSAYECPYVHNARVRSK